MPASPPPAPPWRDARFAAVVALVVFPLLLAQSLLRGMNHDEHQHLAAGILVATQGLLPYRDFPYFHPPVLPLLYGAFLRPGDMLLLEGRLLSTLCATLTVGLVTWLALRWAPAPARHVRLAFGLCTAGLLVSAPVFAETVGRVSNHELSALFALAAVAFHLAAMARPAAAAAGWLASGILLALAIGTRVTLAPLVLPFLIAAWLWSSPGRSRALALFAAGLLVGGIPTIAMFLAAPEGFLYGVLEFSGTNLAYRASTGNTQTMTLPTKLRYFFQPILVTHGSLALAFVGSVALCGWQWWRHRASPSPRLRFLLLLLPFVLAGALAPSPSFLLYYYALIPFAVLATMAAAAESLPLAPRTLRWFFTALVLVGVIVAVPRYESVREIPSYRKWTPPDVHTDARELRPHLAPGARLLTLAPTRALEAGFTIYPAFATGPFAWRVASHIEPEKRRQLGIIAPADLERHLAPQPPDGILTGREDLLEAPFIAYARRHGYQPAPIWHGRETLWRKPPARGHR